MFSILVVDDEPDLRHILRRIFTRAGYTVTEAGHGAEALEAVHRSPPDLVVTDLMMPVMDGVELIRRLRADPDTVGIPILASTAGASIFCDADIMLTKPWNSKQLVAAVHTLLTTRASHPGKQAEHR